MENYARHPTFDCQILVRPACFQDKALAWEEIQLTVASAHFINYKEKQRKSNWGGSRGK